MQTTNIIETIVRHFMQKQKKFRWVENTVFYCCKVCQLKKACDVELWSFFSLQKKNLKLNNYAFVKWIDKLTSRGCKTIRISQKKRQQIQEISKKYQDKKCGCRLWKKKNADGQIQTESSDWRKVFPVLR